MELHVCARPTRAPSLRSSWSRSWTRQCRRPRLSLWLRQCHRSWEISGRCADHTTGGCAWSRARAHGRTLVSQCLITGTNSGSGKEHSTVAGSVASRSISWYASTTDHCESVEVVQLVQRRDQIVAAPMPQIMVKSRIVNSEWFLLHIAVFSGLRTFGRRVPALTAVLGTPVAN